MLVSEIKSRFRVASDTNSFNFSNTQLNNIFAKAQSAYWDNLSNAWGTTLESSNDIAPIAKRVTITPASNVITYASIDANFDRAGFIRPTYVVNGETFSFPAKMLPENFKYSSLSNGTVRYPKYYFQDDAIVLEPSTTPTSLFMTYLRLPYTIDFASPATDIPYSEINIQSIIQIALNNVAVTQREYDQAGSVIQENQFNNTVQ
jgi:hypothetical protein